MSEQFSSIKNTFNALILIRKLPLTGNWLLLIMANLYITEEASRLLLDIALSASFLFALKTDLSAFLPKS